VVMSVGVIGSERSRRDRHHRCGAGLCCTAVRDRRQIIQATAVAAALSGAPSTLEAFRRRRDFRSVVAYLWDATCAVATLVPPGRLASSAVRFSTSVSRSCAARDWRERCLRAAR
jgi:hypothetical protein